FGNDNVISFLKQLHALWRDLAQDSHRKSRAGKRLALQNLFRHTEIASDAADLVLEKVFQRLNELQVHLFGEPADIVMRLDGLRWAADRARFDHVGVESPLHQEFGFGCSMSIGSFSLMMAANELFRFIVEDRDELVADDLAFLFWIGDAA